MHLQRIVFFAAGFGTAAARLPKPQEAALKVYATVSVIIFSARTIAMKSATFSAAPPNRIDVSENSSKKCIYSALPPPELLIFP